MTERPKARTVVRACAEVSGVPLDALRSRSRHAEIVRARHLAAYCVRRLCGVSYAETARAVGCRDHAVALHACRRIEALLASDAEAREWVAAVATRCTGAPTVEGPRIEQAQARAVVADALSEEYARHAARLRELAAAMAAAKGG